MLVCADAAIALDNLVFRLGLRHDLDVGGPYLVQVPSCDTGCHAVAHYRFAVDSLLV